MKFKVGPMSVEYEGSARRRETDEDSHAITYVVQGRQKIGVGSVAATIRIVCSATDTETMLQIEAETTISGLAAQLGSAMIESVGTGILADFATRFGRELSSNDSGAILRATTERKEGSSRRRLQRVLVPAAIVVAGFVGYVIGRRS